MSDDKLKAYSITLIFTAETKAEAEEIRADVADYLLSRNVGPLAEVLPLKRES